MATKETKVDVSHKTPRLEWRRGSLWLGEIMVAETTGWGTEDGLRWRLSGASDWGYESFQEPKDLQAACESGVKEALAKVGVVIL